MLIAGQIILGLILLVVGGELLVRGAVSLAATFKISPLVVGLTIVAFGTSAPELGVSVQAALTGNAGVAIGNVVGSNIINILLVLGASALVIPLIVSSQLIRLDVPLMIFASIAMWAVASDGLVSRFEGIALFISLVIYIVFCIRKSRSEHEDVLDEFAEEYEHANSTPMYKKLGLLLIGLVLLGLGSRMLVFGAVSVAKWMGISQLVIGLTVVAIGTSLPEVVTSIVAAMRGQRDIAVGNVVGSNLFNILCVLGLTATVAPGGVPVVSTAITFDIPVMVLVATICLPIFWHGSVIGRWDGILFLVYYAAYTTFLVMAAIQVQFAYAQAIGYVLLPLTVVLLAFSVIQTRNRMRSQDGGREPTPES